MSLLTYKGKLVLMRELLLQKTMLENHQKIPHPTGLMSLKKRMSLLIQRIVYGFLARINLQKLLGRILKHIQKQILLPTYNATLSIKTGKLKLNDNNYD